MNSITFFYPSKIVGGTEFLFIRLSKYLLAQGIEVYYIDYENGFARNELKESSVKFLNYKNGEKLKIAFDTNLIVPACHIFRVAKEFEITSSTKILLWFLHPWNFVHLLPDLNKYLDNTEPKKIKEIYQHDYPNMMKSFSSILKTADDFNSLYFVDGINLDFNNDFFDLKFFKRKLLPIGLEEPISTNYPVLIVDKKSINIGWLGRICDDKINSIIYLIDIVNEYLSASDDRKINFHIIGNGKNEEKIRSLKNNANLNIILVGTLLGENLDKYIRENIDILFSMGTSLVEGAKLRVPTVFAPFNHNKIPTDYLMSYFYNCTEFNIADEVYSPLNLPRKSFKEIIDDIYLLDKKEEIGEKCFKIFKEFTIKNSAEKLLSALKENKLTYKEYLNFIPQDCELPRKAKKFDLVILSEAPKKDFPDGMMQRIVAIDEVFKETSRIYVTSHKSKKINKTSLVFALLFFPFFKLFKLIKKQNIDLQLQEGKCIGIYSFNRKYITYVCTVLQFLLKSKKIYIHSIYNGKIFNNILGFFCKKTILDIHGVVPEEKLFMSNNEKSFQAMSKTEKKVFKSVSYFITVSNQMKKFYQKKYPFLAQRKFINIPIYDSENSVHEQNDRITFIYAGGNQKWQNIDLMIDAVGKLSKKFSYIFLLPKESITKIEDEFRKIDFDKNRIEFNSVPKSQIYDYYKKATFGFVLRDDIIVNRVSCPTKLIEYLSNGIIPVVLQPNIGDFNDLGYEYVLLEDLIKGREFSEEEIKKMREINYQICEQLNLIKNQNIETLKNLLV